MFMSLLEKRRSIRRFLDRPVEKEKIDLLVEAALRAPSSRGFNPWEFVVVSDRRHAGETGAGQGARLRLSEGRPPRHRGVRRFQQIRRLGGGRLHRHDHHPAGRRIAGARQLLDPDPPTPPSPKTAPPRSMSRSCCACRRGSWWRPWWPSATPPKPRPRTRRTNCSGCRPMPGFSARPTASRRCIAP